MLLAVLVAKAFFFSIYTTSFYLIIQEVSRKSFTLYQQPLKYFTQYTTSQLRGSRNLRLSLGRCQE
ncbi:MAG: hypothetical protein EAZ25_05995 [Oscillatoriales cyanobacterium]|nr:MAG: hypothetical protein EAZ25_05995 [Oscillatoriales cyanobacterium]